jgi:YD repeat-containing protein
VPAASDTVLVSSDTYNAARWLGSSTDPRALVEQYSYDNLGRTTQSIADYTNGTPTNNSNVTTQYGYDGNGNLVTYTAVEPGGSSQQTKYVYGVTTTSGSAVNSNDIRGAVQWPDPSCGEPSSSRQDTYTADALGEPLTYTDRNGNVHTYGRDVLGRLTSDAVTTLGSGVDGAVRRLATAYDTQGNAFQFTSYDAATGGNIVARCQITFPLHQRCDWRAARSTEVTACAARTPWPSSARPSASAGASCGPTSPPAWLGLRRKACPRRKTLHRARRGRRINRRPSFPARVPAVCEAPEKDNVAARPRRPRTNQVP